MKFNIIKRPIKYLIVGVVVTNLFYEAFHYKYGIRVNPAINNTQKCPKIQKFLNKLRKSRKFRVGLSSILIIGGLITNTYQPDGINVPRKPIHFTVSTKNFENINLLEYIDFITSPTFIKTNQDIKRIVIDNDLDREQKIILISYRLHNILNIIGRNKDPMFLVLVMQTLLTGALPGYHAVGCVYRALYKLYTEGKISLKLYELLLEIFNEIIKTTQVKPAKLNQILKKPDKIME